MDTFEIWRLPVTLFESSHQASCVLMGRKRDGLGGKGSRLVREVHSQSLEPFLRTGIPKALYVVRTQMKTFGKLWISLSRVSNVKDLILWQISVVDHNRKPASRSGSLGYLFLSHFKDVKPYAEVQNNILSG